jgi:hypothetical protein
MLLVYHYFIVSHTHEEILVFDFTHFLHFFKLLFNLHHLIFVAKLLGFHEFWEFDRAINLTLFLRAVLDVILKFLLKTFSILSHLKEVLITRFMSVC